MEWEIWNGKYTGKYGMGICLDNIRGIWNGDMEWGYGMGIWNGDMGWDNTGDRRYKINVYYHGVWRVSEAE